MGNLTQGDMLRGGAGIAMGVTNSMMQYKQANKDRVAHENARKETNRRADESLNATKQALHIEKKQAKEEAMGDAVDLHIAKRTAEGKAVAAAGASGQAVSSNVAQGIKAEAGRSSARSALNTERKLDSLVAAEKSAEQDAIQRKTMMPKQERPNAWAYALGAGSSSFRNIIGLQGIRRAMD